MIEPLEVKKVEVFAKLECLYFLPLPFVSSPTVLGRRHGMTDLLWGVPQWPTGMKNVEFLEVFRSL